MTDELSCPKCAGANLRTPRSGGTPVLRCYKCRGMWVSVEEAEQLALSGNLMDPESLKPQHLPEDHRTGTCPNGHGILSRARVEVDEPFFLEHCAKCGGLWFDDGEWHKLASSHLIHHLRDLWDPRWQRRMRLAAAQARHRQRIQERIGAKLTDAIEALAAELRGHPRQQDAVAYFLDRVEGEDEGLLPAGKA